MRTAHTARAAVAVAVLCGFSIVAGHAQGTFGNSAPQTAPGVAQPPVFPQQNDDPSFTALMRGRRQRIAEDRIVRLRAGADHLREICSQLQANLSLHGSPDETDRKLMAEIEKQLKALHNLMVQ